MLKDSDANEMIIAAVRGWTANVHQKGERFYIGEYGIIGHVAVTGTTYYLAVAGGVNGKTSTEMQLINEN